MSDLDQIIKLIDAGYTKEEISQLLAAAPAEEPAEEVKAQPEAPAPEEDPQAVSKIDEAIAKLETLAGHIAKVNLLQTQQPERQSTEDFLASIINPHINNSKEVIS